MTRAALALIGCAIALTGCVVQSAKPVVALPNGYYLQLNAKQQTEIVKRGGKRVLPGPIAAYAVTGELVVGALGEPSAASGAYPNDLPFQGKTDTRYFVLETRSGHLETQLDSGAWQNVLQTLGAATPLRIYAPLLSQ
jgi:hypothetical protein